MASKPHFEGGGRSIEIEQKLHGQDDGKTSWVLKPDILNIVWGNDSRYWILPKADDKNNGAAKLSQVCWLEVTGSTGKKGASKGKKYRISFDVELTSGAFGWNGCPVFMMAKVGKKGKYKWQKMDLSQLHEKGKQRIPSDFVINVPNDDKLDDTVIYFGLYEVWTGRWKGGLNIYEARVEELSLTN